MARTDNDTWDLASSVGATATMVATARALASRGPEPLVDDPFAEPLVRAVGIEFFVRLLDGDIDPAQFEEDPESAVQRMVHSITVRTRFFDDFFAAATEAGIRQAVILAAGLDARSYRLPWPPGTVVYEIDLPEVIEFKGKILAGLRADPTAQLRTVAVDLRDDWPKALLYNGFDRSKPTAWIAEGLLMYLPPEAQDRLFDNITALSAPASRVATEYHPDSGAFMNQRAKALSRQFEQHGLDVDFSELFYDGERSHVMDYLSARGWRVSTQPRSELLAAAGLPLPETDAGAALRNIIEVSAIRS